MTEYLFIDAVPVAVSRVTGLSYVEADHLGTPRVAASPATNAKEWGWDLLGKAFGENAATTAVLGKDVGLRYPGQWVDGETGLHYNYFRDYEASVARYAQSDPIGISGGPSTYAYVNSSPLLFVDYYGLQSWEPDRWTKDDHGYRSLHTNCYGYARNRVENRDPGGRFYVVPNCESLIAGAKEDGMIESSQSNNCGGDCPSGYYKVQLFLDDRTYFSRDYHWYRQDSHGGWSHKRGTAGFPRQTSCPLNDTRDFGDRHYKKYCGTLCAPNNS